MQAESTPLWKIVLGVGLGVLLADLVRMAFAALALGALVGSWGVTTSNPGKITERVRVDLPTQATTGPTALPGPVEARASGISRSVLRRATLTGTYGAALPKSTTSTATTCITIGTGSGRQATAT